MQPSDKGWHMHDKENHNKKQWMLVNDQHEAAQCHEAKAQKECAHECLHLSVNIRSENEAMENEDHDDEGINEDNDKDITGDTQFASQVIPTKLSGMTKQLLTFQNIKVPKMPHISTSTIEALEALIGSDGGMDDEHHTISSFRSFEVEPMKQKQTKDKHVEVTPCEDEVVKNTEHMGLKRQCQMSLEDEDSIIVKAQKLTEHEGCP
ncbi:hypothetical protein EDC04DRAFT_2971086 [Pisolithus marmoratus]|nr:hypothetical protein EDC04DRAFT_2971086 [Pisolithus marmoratus]